MQNNSPILFTQDGYNKLVKEQEDLKGIRKLAVEDLSKARAMGDLSENGYYKSARAKLSSVDHRIRQVKYLLQYGKVKTISNNGTIDIGSNVILKTGNGEKTYSIVGGFESNPLEGRLSHISPLGKALIGKKAGDTVIIQTPSGTSQYVVTSVE
ncbi:MAG TPA: transcription elongation factor GreA [Patescibacteria group bacterium]